jgi:hypothetical protein
LGYLNSAFDPDDLMDEGVSDEEGHFELKGHETEVTNIDPKVNIYHVMREWGHLGSYGLWEIILIKIYRIVMTRQSHVY